MKYAMPTAFVFLIFASPVGAGPLALDHDVSVLKVGNTPADDIVMIDSHGRLHIYGGRTPEQAAIETAKQIKIECKPASYGLGKEIDAWIQIGTPVVANTTQANWVGVTIHKSGVVEYSNLMPSGEEIAFYNKLGELEKCP